MYSEYMAHLLFMTILKMGKLRQRAAKARKSIGPSYGVQGPALLLKDEDHSSRVTAARLQRMWNLGRRIHWQGGQGRGRANDVVLGALKCGVPVPIMAAYFLLEIHFGAGEMTPQLRAHCTLAWDLRSVPTSQVWRLTTARYSSYRGCHALSGL